MLGLVVVVLCASVHGREIARQQRAFPSRTLLGNDIAIDATEEEIFCLPPEVWQRIPGTKSGVFLLLERAWEWPVGSGWCGRYVVGYAVSLGVTGRLGVLFEVVNRSAWGTRPLKLIASRMAAIIVLYDCHLNMGRFCRDLATPQQ